MSDLKTLKDLEHCAPDDPYVSMEPMEKTTDKRTLNSKWYKKALKRYVWIYEGDLRDKAIKWIKELDNASEYAYETSFELPKKTRGYIEPTNIFIRNTMEGMSSIDGFDIAVKVIKHLFNITEVDLK